MRRWPQASARVSAEAIRTAPAAVAPQQAGRAQQRVAWLDAARGIGILLVVAGHVERGIVDAGIAHAPLWRLLDWAIYSFHMALFMLLAGVNVPRSLRGGRRRFLAAKVRTVYWPYLLWSAIQGGAVVALSSVTVSELGWDDIARIPWRPILQFWFLYALMLYCMLVAFSGLNRPILIGAALAALVCNELLDELSLLNLLLFYLPLFIAGVLLAEFLKGAVLSRPLALASGLGTAWLVALLWLAPRDPLAHLGLSSLPCAVLGTAAVLCLSQALRGRWLAALAWLGRHAMAIYVMHVMAGAAARVMLAKLAPGAPEGVFFAVGMAAGLAVPCLASVVAGKLGIAGWLGIGHTRRADVHSLDRGYTKAH